MTQDSPWKALRTLLVERYDEFAQRLSQHLGSKDLANDALHDTFLRIARGGELPPVRNPRGYLFRMAVNIAISRERSERRRLSIIDSDALLEWIIDDEPLASEVMEARADIEVVRRALADMPPRRRAIFEAAWVGNIPHREIAEQHGLSLRMVQIELKHAAEHIAERLAKSNTVDFAPGPWKTSGR